MSEKRKRISFFFLYLIFSSLFIFVIGPILRSGYQYIGDGEIFIFRDGLLPFLLALVSIYATSLTVCVLTIKFPLFDYLSRIIATNILIYILLGFSLVFLRIPLYSRTIIVSEFVVSTILIMIYFVLRFRIFLPKLGVISGINPMSVELIGTVEWKFLEKNRVPDTFLDGVMADLQEKLEPEITRAIAEIGETGIRVYDRKHLISRLTGRLQLDDLALSEFENIKPLGLYAPFKRIGDFLIALLLLPFSILTGIIVGLLITLDSPGPIFFKQQRLGYQGKSFVMYKFRSMYTENSNTSSFFAAKNDKRITRVGHYIRRSRLDELPQIWNVLKGQMSFIGPRPEQLGFAERFIHTIPLYAFRHTVRPGITGWAQVMSGYADDEDKTRLKLEYDFFYIKNISLWLEMVILLKTFGTVVLGRGAR